MSEKKNAQNEEFKIENVEHALNEAEFFIEKNQKPLLIGLGVVVLLVCLILGTRHFYFVPKAEKANVALFKGEQYFAQDSFALALNGDGKDFIGFLNVIDEFGGTDAGNLAKTYAGICYHRLGNNEEAVSLLKGFSGDDDFVAPAILVAIGDCFVDMEKYDDAVSYFEKAAKSNNNIVSPIALKKAGLAYEALKKYDKALKMYTLIQENFQNTVEGYEVEKYIERAKTLK